MTMSVTKNSSIPMPLEFAAQADSKVNFASEEEKILAYWTEIDAFQTSLQRAKDANLPEFTFYDGPPFATGLPHYGHILAGTIKDTVTRYAAQTGHNVSRRFGWDCHGLPVENEIDKALGIKCSEDVMKMGIAPYNAECRSIVMRYADQWEKIIGRCGRWVDFKNDYKTLDTSFMESVWWVFSELYKKGLVYHGFKVMPYSTACNTPLSNFEKAQNYKDVHDPAVIVSFKIAPSSSHNSNDARFDGSAMLAYTTTPWTLPSNLSLCVNVNFKYVQIRDRASGALWIVAESRVEAQLYPAWAKKKAKKKKIEDAPYEILAHFEGRELVGLRYEPLFDYFVSVVQPAAFTVLADDYVDASSGTAIVHQAPAFGEDDYRVCLAADVILRGPGLVCPVDSSGCFTSDVTDFSGQYVKDADRDIIRYLKTAGRLVSVDQVFHSYPHCWRSDTPLLQMAVPSWFINVPRIRSRLVENNRKTYWVPSHVHEKRFHNWLENARDWAVSRTRYWGTPIPVWMSEDGEETIVISSIAELESLSGETDITDLHRDHIDHITIPSQQGKGELHRIPEVFDCWFESGSMPYAQQHYPFENKAKWNEKFPADFIAEGLDQTRGWFYTLMVLSTALFDEPPFKNVVVNGLVLAEDGKKMSKREKNYPDPQKVIDKYGADALRLYLINSPAVRAEPLRFCEAGVRDVAREIFLPWYNTYCLLLTSARSLKRRYNVTFVPRDTPHKHSNNVMDLWIMAALQTLVASVHREMNAYRLDTVVPSLLLFIDRLSRWFVRFNKTRLKGLIDAEACQQSLACLYTVLLALCRLMAPFTPFLVEHMYQQLQIVLPHNHALREPSVHYLRIPIVDESAVNEHVERSIAALQNVIELGRVARQKTSVSLRVPLPSLTIVTPDTRTIDDLRALVPYIQEQLSVRSIVLSSTLDDCITLEVHPIASKLGRRLGSKRAQVSEALKVFDQSAIAAFKLAGVVDVCGEQIQLDEVDIVWSFRGDATRYVSASAGDVVVVLEHIPDEDCVQEGLAREVVSRVQQLRKEALLSTEDDVEIFAEVISPAPNSALAAVLQQKREYITLALRLPLHSVKHCPSHFNIVIDVDRIVNGETIRLLIARSGVLFSSSLECDAVAQLQTLSYKSVCALVAPSTKTENDDICIQVGDSQRVLKHRTDFFVSVADFLEATQL